MVKTAKMRYGIGDAARRICACVLAVCLALAFTPHVSLAHADTVSYTDTAGITYSLNSAVLTAEVVSYDRGNVIDLNVPATVSNDGGTTNYTVAGFSSTGLCKGDTKLETVELPSGLKAVPAYCFMNCTALKSVTFSSTDGSVPTCGYFGDQAFSGCSSLTSIDLPVLTGASLSNEAVQGLDTGSNGVINGTSLVNGAGLAGSSSLETVFVEAGGGAGAYPYYLSLNTSYTKKLKAVVYKTKKSFFDTDKSRTLDGTATDSSVRYYAIDYYASKDIAESDDGCADLCVPVKNSDTAYRTHSKRLGRVELKEGTAMSDIAAGASSLSSDLYSGDIPQSADAVADPSIHDGVLMDATEAYNKANDTSYVEGTYVWAFEQPVGEYSATLNDSLYAYPAKASDLSAGYATSSALTDMRAFVAHLHEKHFVSTYWTDDATWYDKNFSWSKLKYQTNFGDGILTSSYNPYFETKDGVVNLDGLTISLPDGTSLSTDDCDITYKDTDGDTATTAELAGGGAFEMYVTPKASTGYTGTLSQWILLKDHAATVSSKYLEDTNPNPKGSVADAADTYATSQVGTSSATYSVLVGSGDRTSSLVGAGLSGLVDGKMGCVDSSTGISGCICGANVKNVLVLGGTDEVSDTTYQSIKNISTSPTPMRLSSDTFNCSDTPAALALSIYSWMKDGNGAEYADDNTWGDTAILCLPETSFDTASVANIAYQMKAPVFFTDYDGNVDAATAAALKDFKDITVAASDTDVSDSAVTSLQSTLGSSTSVTRLDGANSKSACEVSIDTAEAQIEAGASPKVVTIVDGRDPMYAAMATNLSGFADGPLLVTTSTADSKRIVDFLVKHKNLIYYVDILGKDFSLMSSDSWDLAAEAKAVWTTEGADSTTIAKGDTFEHDGLTFTIGAASQASVSAIYDGARSFKIGDKVAYADTSYTVSDISTLSSYTLAITYEGMDDATYGTDKPESVAYTSSAHVSDPRKSGYTFTGWTVRSGQRTYATKQKDLTLAASTYPRDLTLMATWTQDAVTPSTPAVGSTIKVTGGSAGSYKVTGTSTLTLTRSTSTSATQSVNTITYKKKIYQVTVIAANAFKGSKAKTLTVGGNVKTISKCAFKGAKKLKTLVVKSAKLTKKSVKGSLAGSVIKVVKLSGAAKSKYGTYKKIFAKSNSGRKVTVKK